MSVFDENLCSSARQWDERTDRCKFSRRIERREDISAHELMHYFQVGQRVDVATTSGFSSGSFSVV
eukprot:8698025-Pyramimonas_sp.AAC.1